MFYILIIFLILAFEWKYKNYIEVHMMLENSDGCKYITLRCKDILIEEQN